MDRIRGRIWKMSSKVKCLCSATSRYEVISLLGSKELLSGRTRISELINPETHQTEKQIMANRRGGIFG